MTDSTVISHQMKLSFRRIIFILRIILLAISSLSFGFLATFSIQYLLLVLHWQDNSGLANFIHTAREVWYSLADWYRYHFITIYMQIRYWNNYKNGSFFVIVPGQLVN